MKVIVIVAVQVLLSLGMVGTGMAVDAPPAGSEQIVKGDVLLKEGEEYVIKEMSGREVRVHVNAETKKDGVIKVGDKIEATVTRDGHALSIKQQIPQ
ncbi:MAG TPA: hypothetical protein VHF07_04775 [Nitrospiraceae bacterium]|nr:hypothetical protein [Nitrospiraceae bacterium]